MSDQDKQAGPSQPGDKPLDLRSNDELGPLVEPTAVVTPFSATVRLSWYSTDVAHNAKPGPLYALTPEDVEAVNMVRRERASKALRRLDLCRCDHNEYCCHCWPVDFRPGGVWSGA